MNTKHIINSIKNGKNLEVDLPKYASSLMTSYYKYSMIRLTMNYFTLYEVVSEEENKEVKIVENIIEDINQIIKKSVLSDFDGEVSEKSVKQLDAIRKEVIKKMKVLTAYTDILQVYEHVLNRLEYKYEEGLQPIDDVSFTSEVLQYIFDTKDNVIINDKIKEVIGQLPVRMTKSKYYELVCDSLSVYKGAEKASVDSYIYMMKTSAMLYEPEEMNEYFKELGEFVKELESVSYKDLEKQEYEKLSHNLKEKAEFIGNIVDAYVLVQEVINDLYTVLLSTPYVMDDGEDDSIICKEILKEVNDQFLSGKKESIKEEVAEKLTLTEGRQEQIFFEYSSMESSLYDIKEKYQSIIDGLMLGKIFECLDTVQKLLSSSIFIELDEVQINEIADEVYIEEVTKNLIHEISALFEKSSQPVIRAVIANTINKMPVFFSSTDEVTNYIQNSLVSCRDLAEKTACVQIISDLMAD